MSARKFVLQRLTAALLAPLVLLHLGGIVWAVQGGLAAEDILARTRGSLALAAFYAVFACAAAVHAAIGVETVFREWTRLTARAAAWIAALFGVALALLGLRAVLAVTWG